MNSVEYPGAIEALVDFISSKALVYARTERFAPGLPMPPSHPAFHPCEHEGTIELEEALCSVFMAINGKIGEPFLKNEKWQAVLEHADSCTNCQYWIAEAMGSTVNNRFATPFALPAFQEPYDNPLRRVNGRTEFLNGLRSSKTDESMIRLQIWHTLFFQWANELKGGRLLKAISRVRRSVEMTRHTMQNAGSKEWTARMLSAEKKCTYFGAHGTEEKLFGRDPGKIPAMMNYHLIPFNVLGHLLSVHSSIDGAKTALGKSAGQWQDIDPDFSAQKVFGEVLKRAEHVCSSNCGFCIGMLSMPPELEREFPRQVAAGLMAGQGRSIVQEARALFGDETAHAVLAAIGPDKKVED